MKKWIRNLAGITLGLFLLTVSVSAESLLIPVGRLIGLEVKNDTLTVVEPERGECPAGIQPGDVLLKVNDTPVADPEDVHSVLNRADGSVQLLLRRKEDLVQVKLTPQITSEGPRLGIYLKQGVTGVGTVTWYDPNSGKFGALGHGVNSPDHTLAAMEQGTAYEAQVVAVKKGKSGDPGQLIGTISGKKPIGTLSKNAQQGIFGTAKNVFSGQELPVAGKDEIKKGPATIVSTISGNTPQEYSVEILKVYPTSASAGRNLLLKVTDAALLEATGGIVQGMSGSPIIQDGKLVGAVTHVLVNDPTTGYGIFIENMLDAAA